jgi:DUF4097 and DUF4098 domain-containing protein YvlB
MLLSLLLGSLIIAAPQQSDTTLTVAQGTRLELDNPGGEVVIHAWDRNVVQVKARHSSRTSVRITLVGSVLKIDAEAEHGPPNIVDYDISTPAWMSLKLEGMYSDVSIDGTQADVHVETLNGDIKVKGGSGTLNLHSVQGRISVEGSHGRLELNSVSEGVTIVNADGDISVETISGDIDMRQVRSKSVEAGTLSGAILYDGTIQEGGQYSFVSHSGDIMLGVPEGASAKFNIATLDGEVETQFAVTGMEHPTKRRTTFQLGSGSATVDIESFNGDVKIARPGQLSLPPNNDEN